MGRVSMARFIHHAKDEPDNCYAVSQSERHRARCIMVSLADEMIESHSTFNGSNGSLEKKDPKIKPFTTRVN